MEKVSRYPLAERLEVLRADQRDWSEDKRRYSMNASAKPSFASRWRPFSANWEKATEKAQEVAELNETIAQGADAARGGKPGAQGSTGATSECRRQPPRPAWSAAISIG